MESLDRLFAAIPDISKKAAERLETMWTDDDRKSCADLARALDQMLKCRKSLVASKLGDGPEIKFIERFLRCLAAARHPSSSAHFMNSLPEDIVNGAWIMQQTLEGRSAYFGLFDDICLSALRSCAAFGKAHHMCMGKPPRKTGWMPRIVTEEGATVPVEAKKK